MNGLVILLALVAGGSSNVPRPSDNLVDRENRPCHISARMIEGGQKKERLEIAPFPGLPTVNVYIRSGTSLSTEMAQVSRLELLPSHDIYNVYNNNYKNIERNTKSALVSNAILGVIDKSTIIRAYLVKNDAYIDFQIEDGAKDLADLGTCERGLIESWGANPRRLRPMLLPGQPQFVDLAPFVRSAYPESARVNGIEGRSIALLSLSAEGTPVSCQTVESSGNNDLDSATCDIAKRNERYPVYRTTDGENVNSWTIFSIKWSLK